MNKDIKIKVSNLILEESKNDKEYFLNLLEVLQEVTNKINSFKNDIEIK